MNQLQKKCFVASTGVHLLLALILFIGPGFLVSKSKPDDLPILTFVPLKTVDDLLSGGGNPKAQMAPVVPVPQPPQPQPQPAAPAPTPPPEQQKIKEPDPPKEAKPDKPEEATVDSPKEKPARKIEISTKLVTRKDPNADKKAREEADARQEAKAAAEARRRLARQFGKAAEHMGDELSRGTTVEWRGPGGGGVPYANFFEAVKSAYDRAWVLPDGVVDNDAVTVASVTIARDGTVLSHRIIRPSGDSVVDHSVQVTLERVTFAAPLPDSGESSRTVSIHFSVKAKRSLG